MQTRLFNYFENLIDPVSVTSPTEPPRGLLAFYRYFLRQIWPIMVASCLLSALSAFADASIPVFVGWLVDLFSQSSPDTIWQDGKYLFVMIILILACRPFLAFLSMLVTHHGQFPGFTNLIRWQCHHHISQQSIAFFQNDFAGRIANKVMQTGMALRASVMEVQEVIWYVFTFLVSALIFIGAASFTLTIPILIWFLAYLAVLYIFLPRIRKQAAIMSEEHSQLTGRIVDSYTNIQTVKLFAGKRQEEDYIASSVRSHTREMQHLFRHFTYMWFALHIINGLLLVSVGCLSIVLWQAGHITIGDVAMALPLTVQLRNMAAWIMETANGVFENMGTVEEGMETIARPLTVTDQQAASKLNVENGAISFDCIHFDYGGGDQEAENLPVSPVIDGFHLKIEPGQKIGLVGRSGAGKSTLVNLLLRLYDLNGGQITIDGQNIAAVTQESLRRSIGMVTQDTSLLHRSIRDNICYGRPNASEADIIAAAEKAEAHDFILGLEDGKGGRGYDALVGERGVKLSGGQRQRIAIARLLLKDAPILILDEATSALDSEVEAVIQNQFSTIMKGKTVIAIAHRLSTIAAMDRLIVMDGGQIVEDGTHQQLIERKGLYAGLWQRQSGGFLGDGELVGTAP